MWFKWNGLSISNSLFLYDLCKNHQWMLFLMIISCCIKRFSTRFAFKIFLTLVNGFDVCSDEKLEIENMLLRKTSQLKSLRPSWMVLMCVIRLPALVNDFPQEPHSKSLWPSWMVLMCSSDHQPFWRAGGTQAEKSAKFGHNGLCVVAAISKKAG